MKDIRVRIFLTAICTIAIAIIACRELEKDTERGK